MKKAVAILGFAVGLTSGNAVAQTARIAHLSHGGSLATLDAIGEERDNFGNPCRHLFKPQTIVATSETTAVLQGKMVYFCMGHLVKDSLPHARPRTTTASWGGRRGQMIEVSNEMLFSCACSVSTRPVVAKRFKRFYPEARLIGFDSSQRFLPPVPGVKKQHTKRKKAAFIPAAPTLPQHPGVALGVALVLGLAGMGWLLGAQRPVAQPQTT